MHWTDLVLVAAAAFCGSAAACVIILRSFSQMMGNKIAQGFARGIENQISQGEKDITRGHIASSQDARRK